MGIAFSLTGISDGEPAAVAGDTTIDGGSPPELSVGLIDVGAERRLDSTVLCGHHPPPILSVSHKNCSMVTPETVQAPVTGTTLRTNGPVPADSRQ